jgi:hypothetical protein
VSKIFVAIASYMDSELYDTVKDLLSKSLDPSSIFVSVYCQSDTFPDLESLCETFGCEIFYVKTSHKNAIGSSYAKRIAQMPLTQNFDYYLGIDSHTRFIEGWDKDLVSQYCLSEKFFDTKIVFSTYPFAYKYVEGKEVLVEEDDPTSLCLEKVENFWKYQARYKDYDGDGFGEVTNYLCAGFAFGRSKYFIDNPYDELIYIEGEEITLSIRMRCDGIKIISPPKNYVYHNYVGFYEHTDKRKRIFDEVQNSNDSKRIYRISQKMIIGKRRVEDFFEGKIDGRMGIYSPEAYRMWMSEVKWYN